ncbi:hypothetical protein HOL21_00775 [Candidatus Woesearchaeota archaeon]|jgi:hypothetical protein|nr:hypothetical protein [Candidatus Woesearchaeota archaeon]MBT5396730.1 hypothetical protein [Candidatus Woesearchaeota archaeon]MBT5924694.1 hypothetical protein [Candidatus Woesearchaeota archaeon]MBT6367483.1 hypothetical protein [Candidatus Woesearchaeota archaeon]MBT7762982.1 hypothetical protein [Candidatus Woesearchaeota archaeon]
MELTVCEEGIEHVVNTDDVTSIANLSHSIQSGSVVSLSLDDRMYAQTFAVEYLRNSLTRPYKNPLSELGIVTGLHFWNIAGIFDGDDNTPVEDMLRSEIGWDKHGPKVLGPEKEKLCKLIITFLFPDHIDPEYYAAFNSSSITLRHILKRGQSPKDNKNEEQDYSAGFVEASRRIYGIPDNDNAFGGGAPYAPRIQVYDSLLEREFDVIIYPDQALRMVTQFMDEGLIQVTDFPRREQGKLVVAMRQLNKGYLDGTIESNVYGPIANGIATILNNTPDAIIEPTFLSLPYASKD